MLNKIRHRMSMVANAILGAFSPSLSFKLGHTYEVECFDSAGNLKWREVAHNAVVNVGLDEILDKFYKGSAYTAAHYVGLTDEAPVTVAAGDTMTTHAGWADAAPYSNTTRPALTMGTVTSQSVNNSASKATFNINANDTIGGAFVTTDSTKSGTAGILIGVAAFTGADRSVVDGDTLNVTVTATAATA